MAVNPLIVHEIKKSLGKKKDESLTPYEMAKGTWRFRKFLKRTLRETMFILLGVLSAGFGLRGFLMPNDLIDGGVMGISLLINEKTAFPLSVLIIVINIPFILLGW